MNHNQILSKIGKYSRQIKWVDKLLNHLVGNIEALALPDCNTYYYSETCYGGCIHRGYGYWDCTKKATEGVYSGGRKVISGYTNGTYNGIYTLNSCQDTCECGYCP